MRHVSTLILLFVLFLLTLRS